MGGLRLILVEKSAAREPPPEGLPAAGTRTDVSRPATAADARGKP